MADCDDPECIAAIEELEALARDSSAPTTFGFREFNADLKAAGVTIDGEEMFLRIVLDADNWPRAVARLAAVGRTYGITFDTRGAAPQALTEIVRSYPFDPEIGSRFVLDIIAQTSNLGTKKA